MDVYPLFKTLKLLSANYVKVIGWKSVAISTEEIKQGDIAVASEVKHSDKYNLSLKFNNSALEHKNVYF